MKNDSRVHKSIINAEVNLVFYFLTLFMSFFSRKAFLDCLGTEFIGLVGTLGNILGYLNLAELGIVSCISFLLFKPLQTDNRNEIQEILSVLGYLYNRIGIVIVCSGIIVSLFFPLIFKSADLGLSIIYFSFYSFLGSSLIGYFINYRQILLAADQKNYLVSAYLQSASLIKIGIQIVLAYSYGNLFVWTGIEFVFGLIACIILNWRIDKEYPWLRTTKSNGRDLLKKYPAILKNTKQIFIHKIKDFILQKSDELFVFIFVSLKMVAYYGNYILVVSKLTTLFTSVSDSIGASVGNLVAEGEKRNILKVFWELLTFQHIVAAFLSFSIYFLLEPLISNWLGSEYVLDHKILILLVIYVYIANSRSPIDNFNHAYGLYADVWAAWVELIINVAITIVAGLKWGIIGILLGKNISLFVIVVLWKPHYLFSSGFKIPVNEYWRGSLINYTISAFSFFVSGYMLSIVSIDPFLSYVNLCIYALIAILLFLIVDLSLMFCFAYGAKDCLIRLKSLF